MKVKHVIVCQQAVGYDNGTFSVLNAGLTGVVLPAFPAPLPLTVLVHCIAMPEEPPVHHCAVSVRDQDGQVLPLPGPAGEAPKAALEANLTIQAGPDHGAGQPMPVNFIPTLPALFPKPGRYTVVVEIDGQRFEESLDLRQFRPGA